ncbi:ATP-binding protein [Mesorhizobium sp. Cs1299R1N1]
MSRTKVQAAAVLPTLLSALRLPSISRNWKHLTDTADRDGWPAANLLACLLEIEMAERASRRIQRHREQSGLPAGKTFATFDFDFPSGIRKPHLLSLAALQRRIASLAAAWSGTSLSFFPFPTLVSMRSFWCTTVAGSLMASLTRIPDA